MAKITSKRPRGSGEVVANVVDAKQDRVDAADEPGHGQVSEAGSGLQENASGESEGPSELLTFSSLVTVVEHLNCNERRISCIYHPDASIPSIETTKFGGIRVEVGPIGYQLTSGEVIAL